MKIQFAIVGMINLLLIPAISFACGSPTEGFKGNSDLVRKISRQYVVCDVDGVATPSRVGLYAIYRCINSPTRAVLEIEESKLEMTAIEAVSDSLYEIHADGRILLCKATDFMN